MRTCWHKHKRKLTGKSISQSASTNAYVNDVLTEHKHKLMSRLSYTCQLFSSKMREIFRWQLPKIAEDFGRLPKITKCFQRLPKIEWRLPKITEGVDRFSTTSNRASSDFQRISNQSWALWKRPKDVLTSSQTSKNNWIFIWSGFKQLHSLLSVRREKLVWMSEITILDPQAWDSRIMRESWQVYCPH